MYDKVIKNTTIIDGTGKEAFKGDIAINGERIEAVGNISGSSEKKIDGSGLVTCPGFIDVHNHADITLYKYPEAFNLIMQGITTFAGGNCGISIAPIKNKKNGEIIKKNFGVDFGDKVSLRWRNIDKWLKDLDVKGLGVNYIPLLGYNTVRTSVLGEDFKRQSTRRELEEMINLVEEAYKDGVFGVSIMTDPGSSLYHASREELNEIAKTSKKYNGVFVAHTRHHQNQWAVDNIKDEGYGNFFGYKGEMIAGRYHGLLEVIEISKSVGNVKLHISHLTPAYIVPQPHPKKLDEALAIATLEEVIDKAKIEGVDISFDAIPCEYAIGGEANLIDEFINKNQWRESISKKEFINKLNDKKFRESVKEIIFSGRFKFGMINPVLDPYWFDCFSITECENKEYEGKELGEIIRTRYKNNIIDMVYNESVNVLLDILSDDPSARWCMSKDKREFNVVETFLKHPLGIPSTDNLKSHPQRAIKKTLKTAYGVSPLSYGMFIHFIRKMVKEKNILTLEEAIMKITSFPAERVFNLKDRGVIRKGFYADLVIFDFDKLKDYEDYRKPTKTPDGIKYVFVNGELVCEEGIYTGKRAGKVLKKL